MALDPGQVWDAIELGSVIVTGATAATILTRTRHAHPAVDWILRLLNIVAGNIGHNRNADADSVPIRKIAPLLLVAALLPFGCKGLPTPTPEECAVLIEAADLPYRICSNKTDPEELEQCYRLADAGADVAIALCGFIPPKRPDETE